MENKLHETCTIVEIQQTIVIAQCKPIELDCEREPVRSSYNLGWTNQAASIRLIRRLMDTVNTQEEYEMLAGELEDLQALCPVCSHLLKGGAAPSAEISR